MSGRRLRRIVVGLGAAWLLTCAGLVALIHLAGTATLDASARADVILVLGAALSRDGTPYRALTRRSAHAAALWVAGHAPRIICTGGIGPHVQPPRSEADGCREVLMREGVERTAIVLEETSRSTEENVRNARELMRRHGWTRAILVTDSYHILRARLLASRAGIDAVPSPVPVSAVDSPAFYVHAVVREVAALHAMVVRRSTSH